jgi:midasin (ATPase involved in ribosome maturation)
MVNLHTDNRNLIPCIPNNINHKEDRPLARGIYSKRLLMHDNTKEFRIIHQNIRGLRNKIDELSSSLHPYWPHIVCLTEHHLNSLEAENINIVHYEKGALYCRKNFRMGGVVIFIHNSISYSHVNMDKL